MKREPRPCSAAEAVQRAREALLMGGQYVLGTGNYKPRFIAGRLVDKPFTSRDDRSGTDCAGFAICWCYRLTRNRPGFAPGPAAHRDQNDVDDDINCNSLIEDALSEQDLAVPVTSGVPMPGDLLVYPSLTLGLADGGKFKSIGHVGIVIDNARAAISWQWEDPPYYLLDVAQSKGPNGRTPAVVKTDGSLWDAHDRLWGKPQHRTVVVRMRG